MEVAYASNRGMSREYILDYLRKLKLANPAARIVDIGGAYIPWTKDIADTFVDINHVDGVDLIQGDIHDDAVWKEIAARKFDFCVCSHTLEDIRDPIFVLRKIRETFNHGYIAVPNKHTEFGAIESRHYVGYGHHRWIYTLYGDELRMMAKFPFASYFSPRRRFVAKLRARFPISGGRNSLRNMGPLPWWDESLSRGGNELAFVWKGDLNFKVINGDYSGRSLQELMGLYQNELNEGL